MLFATKVVSNRGDGSQHAWGLRKHILAQVELSLRRLHSDYIDLYQIHYYDPHTRLEETLRTMDTLVQQGKVRYVGCSNTAWQVAEALGIARALGIEPLVSVEPEYSMLKRAIEYELLPVAPTSRWAFSPTSRWPAVSSPANIGAASCRAWHPLGYPGTPCRDLLTPENFAVLEQLKLLPRPRPPAGGAGLCLAPGASSGEQCDCWGDNAGTDHGQCQSRWLAPYCRRDGRTGRHAARARPDVAHPDHALTALPAVVALREEEQAAGGHDDVIHGRAATVSPPSSAADGCGRAFCPVGRMTLGVYHTLETEKQRYAVMQAAAAAVGRYLTKRTRASFPLVGHEETVPGIHHFDEQPGSVEAKRRPRTYNRVSLDIQECTLIRYNRRIAALRAKSCWRGWWCLLQRRGLYRKDSTGVTRRDHLSLARSALGARRTLLDATH